MPPARPKDYQMEIKMMSRDLPSDEEIAELWYVPEIGKKELTGFRATVRQKIAANPSNLDAAYQELEGILLGSNVLFNSFMLLMNQRSEKSVKKPYGYHIPGMTAPALACFQAAGIDLNGQQGCISVTDHEKVGELYAKFFGMRRLPAEAIADVWLATYMYVTYSGVWKPPGANLP